MLDTYKHFQHSTDRCINLAFEALDKYWKKKLLKVSIKFGKITHNKCLFRLKKLQFKFIGLNYTFARKCGICLPLSRNIWVDVLI